MKTGSIANFVLVSAVLAVVAIIGFDFGRNFPREPEIIERTDTVMVDRVDTFIKEKPVPIYHSIIDSVLVAVTDTIVRNDTLYIPLPIERKVYADSTYKAVVSGYKPNLDSLWIYKTTRYITVTNTVEQPRSKWGFGATLGPGLLVTKGGEVRAGIGATVGLQYHF